MGIDSRTILYLFDASNATVTFLLRPPPFTMAVDDSGLRQRNVNNLQVSRIVLPTAEGIKRDKQLDQHTEYVHVSPPSAPFSLSFKV